MIALMSAVNLKVAEQINDDIHRILDSKSANYAAYMQNQFAIVTTLLKSTAEHITPFLQERSNLDSIKLAIQDMTMGSNFSKIGFLYVVKPYTNAESSMLAESGKMIIAYEDMGKDKKAKILEAKDEYLSFQAVKNALDSKKPQVGLPQMIGILDTNSYLGANITIPLLDKQGEVIAVLGSSVDVSMVADFLTDKNLDIYEGDVRYMLDSKGSLVVHSSKELIGKNIFEINPTMKELKYLLDSEKSGTFTYKSTLTNENLLANVTPFTIGGDEFDTHWAFV